MDAIFRSEFTGAGTGKHDGALRRLEYHRYLTITGAWLELKGALWEWSIDSHLADLSRSVGQ
jgi:hypothetical protein